MFGWKKKKKKENDEYSELLKKKLDDVSDSFKKVDEIIEESDSIMAYRNLAKPIEDLESITSSLKIQKERTEDDQKAIMSARELITSIRSNLQNEEKIGRIDNEKINELNSKLDKQEKELDNL